MKNYYEHLLNSSAQISTFIDARGGFTSVSSTEFVRRLLRWQLVRAYLVFERLREDSIHVYYYIVTDHELVTVQHKESKSHTSFDVTNSFERTNLSEIKVAEYRHRFDTRFNEDQRLKHRVSLLTSYGQEILIELDGQRYLTNDGITQNPHLLYRFVNAVNQAVIGIPFVFKTTNQKDSDTNEEDEYESEET